MRCRTRNVRALRCKPDGWLPSWDSLTRLLQTLIVPEWRQSGQLADVSLQGIGFTGKQSDASREERQSRAEGNSIHHGGTEDTERSWAKVKGKTQPRISRIKESGEPLRDSANQGYAAHFLLTCFLSFTPGVNLATLRAAILMTPPVCGLRPLRALRWETENVPKPTRVTRSPFFSARMTASIRVSMAAAALVLVMPVEAAIFSTRSPLFMMAPQQVANGRGNI